MRWEMVPVVAVLSLGLPMAMVGVFLTLALVGPDGLDELSYVRAFLVGSAVVLAVVLTGVVNG